MKTIIDLVIGIIIGANLTLMFLYWVLKVEIRRKRDE